MHNPYKVYTKDWWLIRIDDEASDLMAHLKDVHDDYDMMFHIGQIEKCGHFLRHASNCISGRGQPSDWPSWY